MPPVDPWLKRQNAALRLLGHGVTIEVVGSRIRLRATMPPKPGAPADAQPSQQRISTGLLYPDQAAEGLTLAEALGKALERHRVGSEVFDWTPWLNRRTLAPDGTVGVSGREALELTREWWFSRGPRGSSSEDTWKTCYELYLKRLSCFESLKPAHLEEMVKALKPGSRSRQAAGIAGTAAIRALGWPEEHIETLKTISKGYSIKQVAPRQIPSDDVIQELVDGLPDGWQWPVGLMAAYGCRPHEAMVHAEVMPSGLLKINGGKTGARQSLPLPQAWVERWRLHERRAPSIDFGRRDSSVSKSVTWMFRQRGLPCRPYDLRHAWAVRAIRDPRISPSLAAKSMGHSLTMHSTVYQRWFDSNEMEAVYATLSAGT